MKIDELSYKFNTARNKLKNQKKIEKLEKEYNRDEKLLKEQLIKIKDSLSPYLRQIISDIERYQQIKCLETEI
jgi:hypothetical protein